LRAIPVDREKYWILTVGYFSILFVNVTHGQYAFPHTLYVTDYNWFLFEEKYEDSYSYKKKDPFQMDG
jgi:hypothetical protein